MRWLWKWGKPQVDLRNAPPYWKEYTALFQSAPPAKTPVGQVRFVVFDTETTGTNPKEDHILSMAGVTVKANTIFVDQSFEWCIDQAGLIHQTEAIPVHGLTAQATQRGIPIAEAIHAFVAFVGDAVLVAHHAAFDITIINQCLTQSFGGQLLNQSLDTAHLAIRLEQFGSGSPYKPEDYSLDALIQRYDLVAHDRHNAAGDSFITAQLLLKLMAKAEKRGIKTLGDLMKTKSH